MGLEALAADDWLPQSLRGARNTLLDRDFDKVPAVNSNELFGRTGRVGHCRSETGGSEPPPGRFRSGSSSALERFRSWSL